MTATIDTRAGTISDRQRVTLFSLARKRGVDTDALRDMAGGSIRALSRAQASDLIARLGAPLRNQPGHAPKPERRPRQEGVIPMITSDHVCQIARLMLDNFNHDDVAAYNWLERYFRVHKIRELGTAERAGQVIRVLKDMAARRTAATDVPAGRPEPCETATPQ